MRLAIHGYSQSVACGMQSEVVENGKRKKVRIDATDLLILRWFTDFYPNMKKAIIDGKEYGWITRKKMSEDLPILGITEKSGAARLKKLVYFGLLDYRLVKDGGTYAYYTHGPAYESLLTGAAQPPYLGQSTALWVDGQTAYPQAAQPPYKDRYLDDITVRNSDSRRFAPPTREEVEAYAREKGYNGFPVDRFMAHYESNGWMVGKTKMKNWKAAVTNWWLRDNPSKPNRQCDRISDEMRSDIEAMMELVVKC